MKPTLTIPRWRALRKIEALGDKTFIGADVDLKGPTLFSLEQCGWIKRVPSPQDSAPFALYSQRHHWRLTDAGREAIAALTEIDQRRI